jgi:hypothetical protein
MGPGDSRAAPGTGPARVCAYLYPWDVIGDPSLLGRLGAAGIGHVALAAAYHSVRAATPQHPEHRFVVAETAALYRPVRAAVWAGRRLQPRPAPWTGQDDSFGQAVETLEAAGIGVSAWVVLTHNSVLGRERRDLAVRNCFGDSYEWALCPANEEVRDYAALLTAEAVRGLRLEGISLEACGQLGATHGSHHDKTAGAYPPIVEQLLSVCCCGTCRSRWSMLGLDPDATVSALREAVATAQADDVAASTPEELLGAALAGKLLTARQLHTDALFEAVLEELRGEGCSLRVSLHAQREPWATGASPGLTPASSRRVDCVLVPVDPALEPRAEITAVRSALAEGASLGVYLNLLGLGGADEAEHHAARLLPIDAEELHLYHFGLANRALLPLFSKLASCSS